MHIHLTHQLVSSQKLHQGDQLAAFRKVFIQVIHLHPSLQYVQRVHVAEKTLHVASSAQQHTAATSCHHVSHSAYAVNEYATQCTYTAVQYTQEYRVCIRCTD